MELNHKIYGQGEPIIILHGLFGTLDNWQTIARQLSSHFMIYAIDLRNHGKSPHVEGMDYGLMASDVKEFMENNWLHRARIIGHSMGGKVAMQLAVSNPDMIEKLVVVDIAPKSYIGGHELILETLNSLDLEKLEDRKQAEEFISERIPDDKGTVQFLLKNLSRNPDNSYSWKMNLSEIVKSYDNILDNIEEGKYNGPTLFVRGGRSKYILEADEELIRSYFPAAEIQTIPNVGHWVHAEAPRELLEILENWL
jgi:esterase